MSTIAKNLAAVGERIRRAESVFERTPGGVRLLAVSKTHPPSAIIEAYRAGQRHFAESYVQEALQKQQALGAFDITWHFIGPIQSNKTKWIAQHFQWVHSIDRIKIAQRLNEQRPAHVPPLNVCLQINISHENTKSGSELSELPALVEAVGDMPRLRLRGVMAIPAPQCDFALQREPYRALNRAVAQLGRCDFDTFSFGMSDDLEAAIAEGATMVRIGTAIFGEREYAASA